MLARNRYLSFPRVKKWDKENGFKVHFLPFTDQQRKLDLEKCESILQQSDNGRPRGFHFGCYLKG